MTRAVDVVIASYNGAAKLRRCLGSMLDQPEAGLFRVQVVLDGSTDDSEAMLRGLAEQAGARMSVTWMERSGLARARNHGARLGSAEWLLFLDDDTELPPTFAAEAVAALQGADADIVGFPDEPLSSDGYFARSIRYLELASRRTVGRQLAVKGAALACRRTVFEQVGGFDEARVYYQNEDIEFTQRAQAAGHSVDYLDEPAIHHEAPGVGAYVRKSWRSMADYNGIAARHYYRVNHTLAFGGAVAVLIAALLQDRRRLLPLILAGGAAAVIGGAAVVRLSDASWRYLPGVLVAAGLRLPFMVLGTARYFWARGGHALDEMKDETAGG